MSTNVTLIGNLAADPELKFTASGKAMVTFTVMTSERRLNKDTNEWEDVNVTGWPVAAFDKVAENVAESLLKGDAVIVSGTAASRSWESKEGEKRSRTEVTAREVGASLRRVNVTVNRVARQQRTSAPVADDPWSNPEAPF